MKMKKDYSAKGKNKENFSRKKREYFDNNRYVILSQLISQYFLHAMKHSHKKRLCRKRASIKEKRINPSSHKEDI